MTWIKSNYEYRNALGQTLIFHYGDNHSSGARYEEIQYDWTFNIQVEAKKSDGSRIGFLYFTMSFSKDFFSSVQACIDYMTMYNFQYQHILEYMEKDLAVPPNLGIVFPPGKSQGCIIVGKRP